MPELKPVKSVVVPKFPPIDKLIAFKRVQLDLGEHFRLRIAFCDVNIPTPEHHERWDAMCTPGTGEAYLIDVGDKKYHKIADSASQVEKMSSETQNGRTWNRLVELANENNRTGSLKKARHSIAKIIRDVYHVMNGGEDSQKIVFDHGMDVVDGFFLRQNNRSWENLFTSETYAELRELWDGFDVTEKEVLPFTLPLYFRQLFLAGRGVAEIIAKISWWLDKIERVAKRRETARKKAFFVRRFIIGDKPAGLAHVGNCFEAEAFTYDWIGSGKLAVGIIRNERGHVHIQTSLKHKVGNLDLLASQLEKMEPGLWHHETRFSAGGAPVKMLLNGSNQFTGIPVTGKTDEDLIKLVRGLVIFDR